MQTLAIILNLFCFSLGESTKNMPPERPWGGYFSEVFHFFMLSVGGHKITETKQLVLIS
jgi:hypothetical protein